MNIKEVAERMDGVKMGEESEEFSNMILDGPYVIVYGYSDDNMELGGAIRDEIGAYGGTTVLINENGLLKSHGDDPEYCDECPHYIREAVNSKKIKAIWCPEGQDTSWAYETAIPHETFRIMEGDDVFCIGIVFNLKELG